MLNYIFITYVKLTIIRTLLQVFNREHFKRSTVNKSSKIYIKLIMSYFYSGDLKDEIEFQPKCSDF